VSVYRQELILKAVALEKMAEKEMVRFDYSTRLIPASNSEQGRAELIHQATEAADIYCLANNFNIRGVLALNPESRAANMRNVYEILNSHSVIGDDSKTFTEDEIHEILAKVKKQQESRDSQ
jgi:hypothetical protein